MKRSLLLLALLAPAILLNAQRAIKLPENLLNFAVRNEHTPPVKDAGSFTKTVNPTIHPALRSFDETQLGISFYDLQSNYLLQNRVYFNPEDETVGVVWTRGITATSFPDRGTGYNFFDGTNWMPQPDSRIEDERTGWPNYAPWGADGEMVVAHLASGLKISTRPVKGTGEWSYSTLFGPPEAADLTWPRMITNGEDNMNVHLVSNTYDPYLGQEQATLYYRSLDGGATWDIEHELLDGMGSDYYTEIGADSYGWADAMGDTIAFICASAWHDMFVMRSFDNGDNWEKIMIWEHPYPFFDWNATITDTFFCVDNSATVALGPDGKVHVVFGINRVLHEEVGMTYSLFPYVDGIGYWNEDMEPFSSDLNALSPPQYGYAGSEMVQDYNYVGWTQDVDGDGEITFVDDLMFYRTLGLSTMPSLTVDHEGRVFFVYSSTTETYDNFDYNFKHIWGRGYDPFYGWGTFIDLTANIIHIFDECYFPQIAGQSNDDIHVVYNTDASPGLAFSGNHDWQENRLIYTKLEKFLFFPIGISEEQQMITEEKVSKIYPNPVTGTSYIKVEMDRDSDLTLLITNLMGQRVRTISKGRVPKGVHQFEVNAAEMRPGAYFYTVQSGDSSVTGKMIVR